MTCFHPLKAFQRFGKGQPIFALPKGEPSFFYRQISLPCGRCLGCRIDHSREWALRCVNEASLHKENCFVTLTFNNDNLPKAVSPYTGEIVNTLDKEIMQKFWKRLRKYISDHNLNIKIRYFQCGEYGSQFNRPHYHAIIFGFNFPDRYEWYPDLKTRSVCLKNHVRLYRSHILEKLWPFGFSSIGDVTYESCAYVARYVLKKVKGKEADEYYDGRQPEYIVMSRGRHSDDPLLDDGGIGYRWFKRYKNDVFPSDFCLLRNNKLGKFVKLKPPKYYESIYDTIDPEAMEEIRAKRKAFTQHNSSYELEHSPDRLSVKEQLLLKKSKRLIRSFEIINNGDDPNETVNFLDP